METKIDMGKKGVLVVADRSFTPEDGDRTFKYAELRMFFKGTDGKLIPTKKGVTFRLEHIKTVIQGLYAVEQALTFSETSVSREGVDEPF